VYLISISVEGDRVVENLPTSMQSALKVVVKAVEIKCSIIELRGGKMASAKHLFTLG
jgi:hypothetical protein